MPELPYRLFMLLLNDCHLAIASAGVLKGSARLARIAPDKGDYLGVSASTEILDSLQLTRSRECGQSATSRENFTVLWSVPIVLTRELYPLIAGAH